MNPFFLPIVLAAVLHVALGKAPCATHEIKAGEHGGSAMQAVCGKEIQCEKGQYPNFYRMTDGGTREYCPQTLQVGDKVRVCCADATSCSAGNGTYPPSTPEPTLKPIYYTPQCPPSRKVNKNDVIFFTIDDGPSASARPHLLTAFRRADVKVSFFDTGYNLCPSKGDSGLTQCADWGYENNAKLLAQTVKDGHFLGAHSDFHYYNATLGTCNYIDHKPFIRPAERLAECGTEMVQDMVQGAHQLEEALKLSSIDWKGKETLRDRAIDWLWTYSRLPCTDIWRTGSITQDNFPGMSGQAEETEARSDLADEMYSGDVNCRPEKYMGKPWKNYGFDPRTEWFGTDLENDDEVCRYVQELEEGFETETDPAMKGRMMMLTHDYHFNSEEKAEVFMKVALEMRALGYKIDTVDNWEKYDPK